MSKIKNYTSQVPSSVSISKIEKVLTELGANRVVKDYQDRFVIAIMFEIEINRKKIVFRLPARVEACFNILWSEVKRPKADTSQKKKEQAERTAWKIILDWIEAQSALIQLEQADFAEIFLPYAYNVNEGKTLYQIAKQKGINNLLLT